MGEEEVEEGISPGNFCGAGEEDGGGVGWFLVGREVGGQYLYFGCISGHFGYIHWL